MDAPRPRNVQELRSFLGLLNYYGKFIRNLSSILHPLNNLLRAKQPWCWTEACNRAFQEAKHQLSSAPVLVHYDPELPIRVAGDASAYGIGAVISHLMPDNTEQPIAFASRTLSSAECNYAQVEKEALSLIFAIRKFHQYLYGHHFTLVTDHEPLTVILGPKRAIPALSAARMQRWALLLSAYSYTILFRPTQAHGNADGLSRLPVRETQASEGPDAAAVFNVCQLESLPVQARDLEVATRQDALLSKVLRYTQRGWPQKIPDALRSYWRKRDELTVEANCLLWGTRVVVPAKLQNKVMEELHRGHQGAVRMKASARSHVWWPDLDRHIEEKAKSCRSCQEVRPAPAKAPLHPWAWPTKPWQRVHLDFAGPINGKMLLIVTDAQSKWPEVCIMASTTAEKTIEELRKLFARYGLLEQVVSDNGPQFVAEEFQRFLKINGVRHIRSSAYHPSTNGAAERMVQTVKHALRSGHQRGDSMEHTLSVFLLQYRSTPHSTTGVSPSSLFLGREVRTRLDLLHPDLASRVYKKQSEQKAYHDQHSRERSISLGQSVMVLNLRPGPKWLPGEVINKLGPLTFLVKLSSGIILKRHIDHIRSDYIAEQPQQVVSQRLDVPSNSLPVVPAGPVVETPTQPVQENSPSVSSHTEPGPEVTSLPVDAPTEGAIETPMKESSPIEQESPIRKRYPSRNRRAPERLY